MAKKTDEKRIKRLHERLFDDASAQLDSFGVVLILTLLSSLLLLLVDLNSNSASDLHNSPISGIAGLFTALTLVYSLRASGVSKRIRKPISLILIIGLTFTFLTIILNNVFDQNIKYLGIGGVSPFWVLIAIGTPIATVRRLLKHKFVTLKTLYAAISAYLQIAIAFAYIYLYLDTNTATDLFGKAVESTSYMYYSLVTVTTLGYGDLFSVTDIGRAFSVFEAVIGQVYLVTVVAMMVSLYATNKEK